MFEKKKNTNKGIIGHYKRQARHQSREALAQQLKYIYIYIQIFTEQVLYERYFMCVCFLTGSNILTGKGVRDTNKFNFSEFLRLIL